jgi:hypothetical protein
MKQGQLFNPDNPPMAYPREEADEKLEQIKESLRSSGAMHRYDVFHDRREEK